MAQIIGLPKLSPTMEEGVLVKWVKGEGDSVQPGDLVAEVETDKANMDFTLEDEGVLLKLLVSEGDTIKLGAPVAILGEQGEDISALIEQAKTGSTAGAPAAQTAAKTEQPAAKTEQPAAKTEQPAAKTEAKTEQPAAKPAQQPAKAAPAKPATGGPVMASPLAKTLAIELGIDLRGIAGSGPGGRIVERDVRAAAEGGAPATAPEAARATESAEQQPVEGETAMTVAGPRAVSRPEAEGDYTDQPLTNMRKRIAQRLSEAKNTAPHFYLTRSFDAEPLTDFRKRLNDLLAQSSRRGPGDDNKSALKVSLNDLIIKGVALALRRVPECNAAYMGDAIRTFHRVHVGVAVAMDQGLITPVIRDADLKGIGVIAAEVRQLAQRARDRKLKADEITGSTFTVSNLGMFGIEHFTAIINPPEAGILAVGTVVEQPVVDAGTIRIGHRMTLTMSCDHRVIDGALGARLVDELVDLLEKPESLAL